jgi:hypothetical protein
MSNINNQTKTLNDIAEVQDLSNETAAAIQGGELRLYDFENRTELLGTFTFGGKRRLIANDQISSIVITDGKAWRFYEHADYKGFARTYRGPANLVLPPELNNKVSSFQQVG